MNDLSQYELTWQQLCPVASFKGELEMGPMFVGAGILPAFGEACKRAGLTGRTAVGMDANTRTAAGDATMASLKAAGIEARPVMIGPADGARFLSSTALSRRFRDDCGATPDFFVSVGAGTITDIVKYAAFIAERPFAAVVSAASVDAYTSSIAAMVDDGVKKSLPCLAPAVVLADLDVVRDAPLDLTLAGYGDTLAKFTSCADWLLGHHLTGEAYADEVAMLAFHSARELLERSEAVRARDPKALDLLTRGQLALGISMWLAGSSRPASGAEHLVSHTWDMQSIREDRLPAYHGFQVSVATVQMARLYDHFDRGNVWRDEAEPAARTVRRILSERDAAMQRLGSDPDEVGKVWETVEELDAFRESVRATWDELRNGLGRFIVPVFEIEGAYRRAGCPVEVEDIGVSREEARQTFLDARYLRSRFTILDLYDAFRPLSSIVDDSVQ